MMDQVEIMTKTDITLDILEIGEELASISSNKTFPKLSNSTSLFPFIIQASETMTVRQIAEFLGKKGLNISAATVSRALSDRPKHIAYIAGYFACVINAVQNSIPNAVSNRLHYFITSEELGKDVPPLVYLSKWIKDEHAEFGYLAVELDKVYRLWINCPQTLADAIRKDMDFTDEEYEMHRDEFAE